jgi:hypothetical protein
MVKIDRVITCLECKIIVTSNIEHEHLDHDWHFNDNKEIKWFSWNKDPYEFIVNNAWYPKEHKNFLKNFDPNYCPKEYRKKIIKQRGLDSKKYNNS